MKKTKTIKFKTFLTCNKEDYPMFKKVQNEMEDVMLKALHNYLQSSGQDLKLQYFS